MSDPVIEPDPIVDRVRIYRDQANEWRWQARARNGEIVAVSGEGYKHHSDCYGAVIRMFPDAQFVDEAEQTTIEDT